MDRVPVSVGDVIAGRYMVERIVGQGGMGIVFAAIDRELERRVAVKLLLPERIENEETVQRFLREAKAAARIRSEYVTQVYDTGRLPDGLPYIVMELLSGQDLAERMETSGVFPVETAAACMLQACEALAQAHVAGIIHRDLKPANFFLSRHADGSDVLKVLDFGISKIGNGAALTKSATVIGSPFYMSPEQLQTPTDVDHRTDVWALGVIAYEMLSGKRPFDADTLPALCVSILHTAPRPLAEHRPDLPAALARIVDRCLQKDRTQRCQNVGELANALAPFGSETGRATAQRIIRILETDPVQSDSLNQLLTDRLGSEKANWAHTHKQRENKVGVLAAFGALAAGALAVVVYLVLRDPTAPIKATFESAAVLSPKPAPAAAGASERLVDPHSAVSAVSAVASVASVASAPSVAVAPSASASASVAPAALATPHKTPRAAPPKPSARPPAAEPDPFLRRH
jgi:serine/threonine-protein kinase